MLLCHNRVLLYYSSGAPFDAAPYKACINTHTKIFCVQLICFCVDPGIFPELSVPAFGFRKHLLATQTKNRFSINSARAALVFVRRALYGRMRFLYGDSRGMKIAIDHTNGEEILQTKGRQATYLEVSRSLEEKVP